MLDREIRQCKIIFHEIDKPENKRPGFAMLATAGLEEMLKAAQHRIHLTAFGAFLAGGFVGGIIMLIVFVGLYGGR